MSITDFGELSGQIGLLGSLFRPAGRERAGGVSGGKIKQSHPTLPGGNKCLSGNLTDFKCMNDVERATLVCKIGL